MEEINIAEILRNEKKGIKLYCPICGNVELLKVALTTEPTYPIITVNGVHDYGFMKDGRLSEHGECMLFPSKEMRDWEKFQWKKGDILTATDGTIALFDGWADNYYMKFTAKYSIEYNGDNTINIQEDNVYLTEIFKKSTEQEKSNFIKELKECYGRRLNLKTLKTEQQFDDFAKEGKTWDGGKNEVVDLPKKGCEFKPFDRVLVRDYNDSKWVIDIFSHTYKNRKGQTIYSCISSSYFQCIHYNDQTKHLLGTTDEWEDGDLHYCHNVLST